MKIERRLKRLGFADVYGGCIGKEPTVTWWYENNNVSIRHNSKGFHIWVKDEQIGATLGHVKISTIKDIIKQSEL